MSKRPIAILLTSLLFLYFPFELLRDYRDGYEISVADGFFSGVLPILVLIGLLRVTRLGWLALIGFVAVWGINDLYSFYEMRGASILSLLTHLMIYSLSLSYFINPRIRTLYFDPKMCWWKTKRRYETHLPLIVNDGKAWSYPVLRNVSEGGCFVETPHPAPAQARLQLSIPLPVPLTVPVIHSEGVVRWSSHNPLRPGMGIEFVDVSSSQKKALKQFVRLRL